jgi:hypothetical protein
MGDATPGDTFERLELKYLIDEATAGHIRRALPALCDPDPFMDQAAGLPPGYWIYSLYLDSPGRRLHQAKLHQEGDRFKLRARHYGQDGPVHLEIKRKVIDVIHKTRVTVARHQVSDAAHGFAPPLGRHPTAQRYLDLFAYLQARLGALPSAMIRYRREAWISRVDRYARVTFDRRICARAPRGPQGWDLSPTEGLWHSLDDAWVLNGLRSPVVLELKCETRVPLWMSRLIREAGLTRSGYSKYTWGLIMLELQARGTNGKQGLQMLQAGL